VRKDSLQRESLPVPDPTPLTTIQLETAIRNLRDLVEAEFKVSDAKFNAMETAVKLLQEVTNQQPTVAEVYTRSTERFSAIKEQFESIEILEKERFSRVEQQFVERDKRIEQLNTANANAAEQLRIANATAIAAALQAQKEAAGETQKASATAIAKSEAATTESIRQLTMLFQTSIAALSTQVQEVKSRLDRGEGGTTRRHGEAQREL
jgi:hypothetical protein